MTWTFSRRESTSRIWCLGGPRLSGQSTDQKKGPWEAAHVTFPPYHSLYTPSKSLSCKLCPSFSLPGPCPTLVPKPHDAVCSVTLLVSLQLHGPRMGIYASWSARSLPVEDLRSESEGGGTALLRPNEWLWLRGEGQTCLPPCGLENQGSWFAVRAENETDTKRGTRKELEKPMVLDFWLKLIHKAQS